MKKKAGAKAKKAAPTKKVMPIPAGYHAVTPYLSIKDAARALDFYKKAFGAKETVRMPMPDGKIGHAEIKIGDSHVMLADEMPAMDFLSPHSRGGTTITLHLYVKDVDATVAQAAAAGAKVERPVTDQFYGDRAGTVVDPFGHRWYIATHTEDLSPAEIRRRGEEMMKKMGS